MSDLLLAVKTDHWGGDSYGHEWTVHYELYEVDGDEGPGYEVYKTDGYGNGNLVATFESRFEAERMLYLTGKIVYAYEEKLG